jgi:serine/threonine protein kinase
MAGFEKFVAVKVIHPHLAAQSEFVKMFLDEARLSAKIQHPNALEIFEVGEDDGLFFIVAELVRGQSLMDLIVAAPQFGESLEPRMYLSIIAKVCDALHFAHTLKSSDGSPLHLVHRDISPGNILVSYQGVVKLIDFGIAQAKGRHSTTRTGVVKGKLAYMAPEQWKKQPLDQRADIFSLGVVLYYLATGQHPFPGDTEAEQLARLVDATPVPPRVMAPNIEPALERTILKAMAMQPSERHQTAEELGWELRQLILPVGGVVDNTDIAALMGRYFSRNIERDRETIEKAIAGFPTPDSGAPLEERASFGLLPQKEAKSDTECISRPFVVEKSSRMQRAFVVTVSLVMMAAALSLYYYFQSTADKTSSAEPSTGSPSMLLRHASDNDLDSSSAAKAEVMEGPVPQPADIPEPIPDLSHAGSEHIEQHRQGRDGPSDEAVAVESVAILLKGLPDSSTVLINERVATLVDGRVLVPADGHNHKLIVLAEGYLPYQVTISPKEDGQLSVQLKRKGVPQRKSIMNRRKAKTPDNETLAECPYCDP